MSEHAPIAMRDTIAYYGMEIEAVEYPRYGGGTATISSLCRRRRRMIRRPRRNARATTITTATTSKKPRSGQIVIDAVKAHFLAGVDVETTMSHIVWRHVGRRAWRIVGHDDYWAGSEASNISTARWTSARLPCRRSRSRGPAPRSSSGTNLGARAC